MTNTEAFITQATRWLRDNPQDTLAQTKRALKQLATERGGQMEKYYITARTEAFNATVKRLFLAQR